MKKPPGKPPSRRGHGPSRDDDRSPTHQELSQAVADAEAMLRDCWGRAPDPSSDILVLGDLNRKENLHNAAAWWKRGEINRVLREAEQRNAPPMMPFVQPRGFLLVLEKDGDFAHRQAAKEIRAVRNDMGFVPLLVVPRSGVWVTAWAPPGLGSLVLRHLPETGPEAN